MLAKTKMKLRAAGMRFIALGPATHALLLKVTDMVSHFFGGPCVGH